MAKITFDAPIKTVQGSLKDGVTIRRKKKSDGTLGEMEFYIKAKRNYEAHPIQGKELASVERFRKAATQASAELSDPARQAYWEARFRAQLKTPEAGNTKCYQQLYAYVRAMIIKGV